MMEEVGLLPGKACCKGIFAKRVADAIGSKVETYQRIDPKMRLDPLQGSRKPMS
jgi:hypothetical protein